MKKNNNIIVINGRHYNARTGEALSHPTKPATPVVHTIHKVTGRKPARHAAVHTPKPSQTLMRQAVKKPSGSLKRRLKVQGHLGSTAGQTHSKAAGRSSFRQTSDRNLSHHTANERKGRLISHFSPDLFSTVNHTTATTPHAAPASRPKNHLTVQPSRPPRKPRTTAELLEYAVQHAGGRL